MTFLKSNVSVVMALVYKSFIKVVQVLVNLLITRYKSLKGITYFTYLFYVSVMTESSNKYLTETNEKQLCLHCYLKDSSYVLLEK